MEVRACLKPIHHPLGEITIDMKPLLFAFLFLPLFASAQIDKEDYKMTTDSTLAPAPDTMFYLFRQGVQTFVRPNGNKKETDVFQGLLINRVGGVRQVGITSGQVQRREYLDWLIATIEMENNDIDRVAKDLETRRARRSALVDEIQRVRSEARAK